MKESPVKEENQKLYHALRSLKNKGLEGLIIYSRGTCSILRPSYLYYFSEYKPMGQRNAAIISKEGDIILLVEPAWDASRVSRKSWIRDVRGTSDFLKDITKIMGVFNMNASVGVVGLKEMTDGIYTGIEKHAKVVPADEIVEEVAREKTPEEIEVVRKAASIADIGFRAFLNNARIGIREYELAGEMEYAMRHAGADDIFILLSSGRHNYEMHEPTDRRIERGDVLIGEITPVCKGQFFQLCRTIVLGQPNQVLREKYDMLLQALKETLTEVKAGAPACVISKVMNRVISEAGYRKYCYPPYMRARGHGFGAGSIAPGATIDDNTQTYLFKDQIVVIHPNQWLPEVGYLACGETYLITDSGTERFSRTETKLYAKEEEE
jgi:Xaa-Pro dipeptidase